MSHTQIGEIARLIQHGEEEPSPSNAPGPPRSSPGALASSSPWSSQWWCGCSMFLTGGRPAWPRFLRAYRRNAAIGVQRMIRRKAIVRRRLPWKRSLRHGHLYGQDRTLTRNEMTAIAFDAGARGSLRTGILPKGLFSSVDEDPRRDPHCSSP